MKVPTEIIALFEREAEGMTFGQVTLKAILHDGREQRYIVTRERSIIPGKPRSGSCEGPDER